MAATLPPPLLTEDTALAALQTQDRAWQTASLAFYRNDQAGALAAFQRIARSASVHHAMARYMMAEIRAGTVPPTQSIAEVKAILADPSLAPAHPQAQQLLGWIGATVADAATRSAQVRVTLEALEIPMDRLARDPVARRRYALALGDIDDLHQWSRYPTTPGWWLEGGPPAAYTASRAMMDAAKTDPMAAWVLFPPSFLQGHAWSPFVEGWAGAGWGPLADYAEKAAQGDGATAFAWRRIRRSLPSRNGAAFWADVTAEEAGATQGDERAIAALAFDFYHQVRLALGADYISKGDADSFDAAVAAMTTFPFPNSHIWRTARRDGLTYLMTAGRLNDARRWRDAFYPRPATEGDNDADLLQILAEDEAHFARALAMSGDTQVLPLQNNLSIAALRRLATRADVPMPLRAKFARIAWSRTYALGRPLDADLDRLMRGLNPAMTAGWTSKAGHVVRPGDRRALLDVLRTPAINIMIIDNDRDIGPNGAPYGDIASTGIDLINHDDDNWWCAWARNTDEITLEPLLKAVFFVSAELDLINGDQAYGLRARLNPALAESYAFKSRDPAETEALAAIPCAPKLLTERVLDWVNHPRLFETRQGQAEALALAVKATHYGCYSDGPHGVYSKAAWTLLHTRFPASDWAAKTKYWYNCPMWGGKSCS